MVSLEPVFFILIIGVLDKCNALDVYTFPKKYDIGKSVELEDRKAKLKCALSCSGHLDCDGFILSTNLECKLKISKSSDVILLKSDLAEYSRSVAKSNISGSNTNTNNSENISKTEGDLVNSISSPEINTDGQTIILSKVGSSEDTTSVDDTTFGIEDTTSAEVTTFGIEDTTSAEVTTFGIEDTTSAEVTTFGIEDTTSAEVTTFGIEDTTSAEVTTFVSAQFQQTLVLKTQEPFSQETLAPVNAETPGPTLSFTLPPYGVATTFIPAFVGNIETELVSSSSGTTTATHDPNMRCMSTNMTNGDTSFEIKFPFNRKASLHDALVYVYDCPKGTLLVSKKCARMIYTKQTSMNTAKDECEYSKGFMVDSLFTESILKIKAWMVKKAVSKLWVSSCNFLTDVEGEEFQTSSCTLGVDEPILCFTNAIPHCSTRYTNSNRCFQLIKLKKTQEDAAKRCKELSATFPKMTEKEDNENAIRVWRRFGGRAMFGVNDFSGSWKNYDGTDRSPSDYNYFQSWPSTSGDQFMVLVEANGYYWSVSKGTEIFFCEYKQGYTLDFLVTKGGSTTTLKSATFAKMNDASNEKYRLYAYSGSRSVVDEVKIKVSWDTGSTYQQPDSEMEICYTLQAILEP